MCCFFLLLRHTPSQATSQLPDWLLLGQNPPLVQGPWPEGERGPGPAEGAGPGVSCSGWPRARQVVEGARQLVVPQVGWYKDTWGQNPSMCHLLSKSSLTHSFLPIISPLLFKNDTWERRQWSTDVAMLKLAVNQHSFPPPLPSSPPHPPFPLSSNPPSHSGLLFVPETGKAFSRFTGSQMLFPPSGMLFPASLQPWLTSRPSLGLPPCPPEGHMSLHAQPVLFLNHTPQLF